MIGLVFELFIIAYTIGLWLFMKQRGYRNISRKFVIMFLGVLFFELISEPMWLNTGFDKWAYIYRDITWVLTLGWVGMLMTTITLVDYAFRHLPEPKKFVIYLLVAETITVIVEGTLIQSGLRGYAPMLLDKLTGLTIPFTIIPLEAIYAIPMFVALIIGFYKYANYIWDEK